MIKIRLARHGSKNTILYRIVAINEREKREGAPLEVIGIWSPAKKQREINKDRLKFWLSQGAKLTKAVEKVLM